MAKKLHFPTEAEDRMNESVNTISNSVISLKEEVMKKFEHLETEHLEPIQAQVTKTNGRVTRAEERLELNKNNWQWARSIAGILLAILVTVGGWFFFAVQNIPTEREDYIAEQLPAIVQNAIRAEFDYRDSLKK